jgi:hypothetical protein
MAALRTITHQLPKSALASRSFSIAARRMAAGDTGATRAGGAAQGDAFTKREQANEADYVRKQELEKLRKRISDSEKQLAKDKKDAEELAKQK